MELIELAIPLKNATVYAKISTTTALMALAKSVFTSLIPILAKIAERTAKRADKGANVQPHKSLNKY